MKNKTGAKLKFKKDYYVYLDELRKSGVVNMFGASVYLEKKCRLDHETAIAVLADWMKTFNARHSKNGGK